MNGYQVCEQLKANAALADVPVIFVSALSETVDMVRAFRSGGVDYITKPLQIEEVEARVQTHLSLRRLRLELEERNRRLSESYEQLAELERLRDGLVHMVVHDLRGPLTGLSGYLQLLEMQPDGHVGAAARGYIAQATAAGRRLDRMIASLLDINRLEQDEMPLERTEVDLAALCAEVLAEYPPVPGQARPQSEPRSEPMPVDCDRDLIKRVIGNLVGNALKFTPASGRITVDVGADEPWVRVRVGDTGPGIPPDFHRRIFEKFGQVEMRRQRSQHSTGLGLAFCRLAVEAHGGEIGVESEVGAGSTFWFRLPRRSD